MHVLPIRELWIYAEILSFLAEIPDNEYIKYFSPDHLLRIPNGHMVGAFSKFALDVLFYLAWLEHNL